MAETIFQHFIFQEFILPFLLAFMLVFALLEKTEILGKDKKTINAIVAFVAGIILVTAVFPKSVITNLVLFLTISIIVVFVIMGLWTFIIEGDTEINTKVLKWFLILGVGLGLLFLIIWTIQVQTGLLDWISERDWGGPLWTNIIFAVVIAVALALVLKDQASGGKG
jgi:hypothetical protein